MLTFTISQGKVQHELTYSNERSIPSPKVFLAKLHALFPGNADNDLLLLDLDEGKTLPPEELLKWPPTRSHILIEIIAKKRASEGSRGGTSKSSQFTSSIPGVVILSDLKEFVKAGSANSKLPSVLFVLRKSDWQAFSELKLSQEDITGLEIFVCMDPKKTELLKLFYHPEAPFVVFFDKSRVERVEVDFDASSENLSRMFKQCKDLSLFQPKSLPSVVVSPTSNQTPQPKEIPSSKASSISKKSETNKSALTYVLEKYLDDLLRVCHTDKNIRDEDLARLRFVIVKTDMDGIRNLYEQRDVVNHTEKFKANYIAKLDYYLSQLPNLQPTSSDLINTVLQVEKLTSGQLGNTFDIRQKLFNHFTDATKLVTDFLKNRSMTTADLSKAIQDLSQQSTNLANFITNCNAFTQDEQTYLQDLLNERDKKLSGIDSQSPTAIQQLKELLVKPQTRAPEQEVQAPQSDRKEPEVIVQPTPPAVDLPKVTVTASSPPTNPVAEIPIVHTEHQMETPGFDRNKKDRLDVLKQPLTLSQQPSAEGDQLNSNADIEPSTPNDFHTNLIGFVLRQEGLNAKMSSYFQHYRSPLHIDRLIEELINYSKSRLINILKDDFKLKETGYILRRGDVFSEAFEKSNRVRADQLSFLKTELHDLLAKNEDELMRQGSMQLDDEQPNSPEGSNKHHGQNSSNNSSVDKKGSGGKPLKSKKGNNFQSLKLKTQFASGERHESQTLQKLKSLYPDEQEKPKKHLVKKDTMMVENNQIEKDDLENIVCEQVPIKMKMKKELIRLIEIAAQQGDMLPEDAENLDILFNYDHIPLLVLLHRFMNEPIYSNVRGELTVLKGHKIDLSDAPPVQTSTALNGMRALVQFLYQDLGYLSKEQREMAEYLIDRTDVCVGAIYEVYIVTEDLSDFTHSLICNLRKTHLIGPTSPKALYSYTATDKARAQVILRSIRSVDKEIDIEELFTMLSREGSVQRLYNEIIGEKSKESPENLIKLRDALKQDLAAVREKVAVMDSKLRQVKRIDRRKSFKEVHDEVQILMMDNKDELEIKDPEIYKSIVYNQPEEALMSLLQECEKTNENTKVVSLLNNFVLKNIQGVFTKEGYDFLNFLAAKGKPMNFILHVYHIYKNPGENKASQKLKENIDVALEMYKIGEEDDFLDSMNRLFKGFK